MQCDTMQCKASRIVSTPDPVTVSIEQLNHAREALESLTATANSTDSLGVDSAEQAKEQDQDSNRWQHFH